MSTRGRAKTISNGRSGQNTATKPGKKTVTNPRGSPSGRGRGSKKTGMIKQHPRDYETDDHPIRIAETSEYSKWYEAIKSTKCVGVPLPTDYRFKGKKTSKQCDKEAEELFKLFKCVHSISVTSGNSFNFDEIPPEQFFSPKEAVKSGTTPLADLLDESYDEIFLNMIESPEESVHNPMEESVHNTVEELTNLLGPFSLVDDNGVDLSGQRNGEKLSEWMVVEIKVSDAEVFKKELESFLSEPSLEYLTTKMTVRKSPDQIFPRKIQDDPNKGKSDNCCEVIKEKKMSGQLSKAAIMEKEHMKTKKEHWDGVLLKLIEKSNQEKKKKQQLLAEQQQLKVQRTALFTRFRNLINDLVSQKVCQVILLKISSEERLLEELVLQQEITRVNNRSIHFETLDNLQRLIGYSLKSLKNGYEVTNKIRSETIKPKKKNDKGPSREVLEKARKEVTEFLINQLSKPTTNIYWGKYIEKNPSCVSPYNRAHTHKPVEGPPKRDSVQTTPPGSTEPGMYEPVQGGVIKSSSCTFIDCALRADTRSVIRVKRVNQFPLIGSGNQHVQALKHEQQNTTELTSHGRSASNFSKNTPKSRRVSKNTSEDCTDSKENKPDIESKKSKSGAYINGKPPKRTDAVLCYVSNHVGCLLQIAQIISRISSVIHLIVKNSTISLDFHYSESGNGTVDYDKTRDEWLQVVFADRDLITYRDDTLVPCMLMANDLEEFTLNHLGSR